MLARVRFGEVPTLVASRTATPVPERGTVLVYHPLGEDKSLHEDDLERLAEAGFLAVGVDAIAHGERRVAGAYARFRADPFGALLEVVTATAAEVPGLVDALVARGWASPGRVGIVGVSLGGFVAYGAALEERRISAAVCIAAAPDWGPDPRSPLSRPDAFWPPEPARALHAALARRYAAAPERQRHLELPGEGHRMSAAGWALARAEAERWMERFVGGAAAAELRP
jgi:alpha-beta hydrolase superfamily lysophospholipase